jgi:hypothetical protein
MKNNKTIKWIGLAKVRVLNESNILKGNMAYTNLVGLAKNKSAFRKAAKSKVYTMDLELLRLEEAEPLADRLNKFEVDEEILSAAKQLSNLNVIGYTTFHSYFEKENSG